MNFEVTIEDGMIIIPKNLLEELKLKDGDKVSLALENGKIIVEKKKGIERAVYESLISDARAYAESLGLDENDVYNILEEYLEESKMPLL